VEDLVVLLYRAKKKKTTRGKGGEKEEGLGTTKEKRSHDRFMALKELKKKRKKGGHWDIS